MRHFPHILAACLISFASLAESNPVTQRWVAHPDKSTVGFIATQEGAEFNGSFNKFNVSLVMDAYATAGDSDGLISFQLRTINATVNLGSVDTQYAERDEYLAQKEWFYTKLWPDARFVAESESIQHNGANGYTVDGQLTLKGISKQVQLVLQLDIEDNNERGRMQGEALLNRLDFEVGDGEWSDPGLVGDTVKLSFDLQLLRAFE
jgi:polyisoprenoid-binding protein YceI